MRGWSCKVFLGIVVVSLAVAYSACACPGLGSLEGDYLGKNPVLVFCVRSDLPPLNFVDRDGEYKGYLVDYLRGMSIHFGFMVRFVSPSMLDMCQAVSEDLCHAAVSAFPGTNEFPPAGFMGSRILAGIPVTAFIPKGSPISGPKDLKGKTVAVWESGFHGKVINSLKTKATCIPVKSLDRALQMLRNGEVSAVVGIEPVINWALNRSGTGKDLFGLSFPVGSICLRMVVKNGNQALLGILNDGISYLDKKGIGESIERKWFGTSYGLSHGSRRYVRLVVFTIAVLLGVILVVVLWNFSLSRKVRKKTEELQLSERRYRSLFNNLSLGVFRVDIAREEVVEANLSFAFMFGYASREEVLGRGFHEFFEDPAVGGKILNSLREKGFIRQEGVSAKRKDGSTFFASISVVLEKENGSLFADGSVEDVTEKLKMEREMLKTSRLESLSVLAGGIAHDFNNILTSLLGKITLAKEKTEGVARRYLEEAERAVFRASGLTKQLLTFAKGGEPVKKRVNVYDLVRDSVSFALRGSNVKPFFSIPDGLPDVNVDKAQISQVINNLVINAKQSMPHGGFIEVKADEVYVDQGSSHPFLGPGRYVKITISDQGHGIPKDILPKVFDPFFTTKDGASGLGLSSCYSILKKHGGGIEIESEEGKGTDVHIYLPVAKEELKVEASGVKEPSKGGRILVVDDEEDIRNICRDFLSSIGFVVDTTGDAVEAISIFRSAMNLKTSYDLVILDLTMPGGMGGLDILKELKKINPDVKAIVISGYSTDPVLSRFKECGFSGALVKPFTLKELEQVVREVLSS